MINTCMAWRVEPDIQAFVKKVEDKQKVVVLTTTGDPDLTIEVKGVDSVTSASRMENAEAVSQRISGKLREAPGERVGRARQGRSVL